MYNKKVSACIVTHNNQDIIYKTVSSLLNFTYSLDFTLYISDNASTDETLNIIRDNFKEVIILNNGKNIGFGAAHNSVLGLIDSDYHFIINPDIRLDSEVILGLCDYLDKNEDVAMSMPNILNIDGTNQHLPKKKPKFIYLLSGFFPFLKKYRKEYTMSDCVFLEPQEIDFCSGCFMVVRSSYFKNVNGFDDRYFMYFEDVDLTMMMQRYGKITINPHFHVYHIWNRESHKKLKYLKIQILSMFKFFYKWKFKERKFKKSIK